MILRPRVAACGGAAALLCSLAAGAVAGALDVQITTVRAAQRGPSDSQLDLFRPRLRRLVGYRSYHIIHDERRHCSWGNREAFAIPGGRLLHIMPKGMRDQAVMMQIQLVEGARALVDTDVRLQNRGVMLFSVGQGTAPESGPIIIMVRAEE